MAVAESRPAIQRTPPLTVGTTIWLASELMFFAGLFAAYFTLRSQARGPWPPEGVELETGIALAFTLVLVASSFTLHRASLAARAGNDRGFRRWVLVTIALGALFVANQAREWSALSFGPATHSFGSAFYVMTGFHGLHVIGGLLAMAVVLGTTRPAVTATGHAATEVVAAYWHFVDVVWIGLFAVLFLLR